MQVWPGNYRWKTFQVLEYNMYIIQYTLGNENTGFSGYFFVDNGLENGLS